jgi:iron complex outermembrane receptor protein
MRHGLFFLALLASLAPSRAWPDSSIDELAEIVVSATRRGDQVLQDVPMSVQVLSPQDLLGKGLTQLSEYLATVPSVNVEGSGPINRIQMRGLVSSRFDNTDIQDRALVGVYLDDIPITLNNANPDIKVVDLSRIEILRGPQGTLFGDGTMSGAIRYITRKPTPDAFQGWVEGTGSITEHGGGNWSARGFVNVPLAANQFAATLGVYQGRDSGFINNLGLGIDNYNASETTQVRVALRWTPAHSLTVDTSFLYLRLDNTGFNSIYTGLAPLTTTSLTPLFFHDVLRIGNLTFDDDIGFANIVCSSSYVGRVFNNQATLQFYAEDLVHPGIVLPDFNDVNQTLEQFSQEIRLVSRPGRLQWTVGGFFEHQRRGYVEAVTETGFDATIAQLYHIPNFSSTAFYDLPANLAYYGPLWARDQQVSEFGETTYELLPKLNVTVGLRHFDEKNDATAFQNGFAGAIGVHRPLEQTASVKSSGTLPKFALSYKVHDDLLLFGELARGFRFGGINYPVPATVCRAFLEQGQSSFPETFGPDEVKSYSLGEKSTLAGGNVTVDVSAFLIKWKNPQVVKYIGCNYFYEVNQGSITSRGIEVDARVQLTSRFQIGFSGSLTDAVTDSSMPAIGAIAGDRVPLFPRVIADLSGKYSIPLSGGKLVLSADYTRRTDTDTEFNTSLPQNQVIPASNFLNADVSYVDDSWSVGIFATNLTNDLRISSIYAYGTVSQPGLSETIGRPRSLGLRVRKSF